MNELATVNAELVKPDLLIRSSINRDVVSDDDNKLLVKSHGGAKTHDILKMLTKMKSDEYGDIYIHIASNDCATKKPVPEIVENMDNIIVATKRVSSSGHVTISGICPRTDDTTASARGGGGGGGGRKWILECRNSQRPGAASAWTTKAHSCVGMVRSILPCCSLMAFTCQKPVLRRS